jgi:hypothetical protein
MSVIDHINKLAATEREIDRLERHIAFLSSLDGEDLAKALPRLREITQSSEVGRPSFNQVPKRIGFLPLRLSRRSGALWHHGHRFSYGVALTTAALILIAAKWHSPIHLAIGNWKVSAENSSEQERVEQVTATPVHTYFDTTSLSSRKLVDASNGNMLLLSRPAPPAVSKRKKEDHKPATVRQDNKRKYKSVVSEASFVRARPNSQAAILTTLQPGTEIEVLGYSGDYFRVRVMTAEGVRGYVHREDAFFKPTG